MTGRMEPLLYLVHRIPAPPNKGNKIQFVVLPDGVHLEFTTRVND